MQPVEDVHEVVESDTEVEEFGQQQQTQDEEEEEAQVQVEFPSIARSRPKRTIKPPQRYGWETDAIHYTLNMSEGDPTTFQEVIESSKWESWMGAMMDEMESLHQNSVWELFPKLKDRKVIGYKLVFMKKEEIHEKEPIRFKARLVANGGTMGHEGRVNGCENSVPPWRLRGRHLHESTTRDGKIIMLLLYVDDTLIAYQDMSKIRELKILLGKEFDMKDLDPA
ncbi:PREDICTED: Retrovirus-related Pol poly from [Prunus dulcis]|uniref:PREDICTED: Retrovirus-related Pol poly from n=1 Tax=Prunus dulcis TaxID=3755 RepID=A0A5E4F8N3_PRUDU|nr:PREDICTED: Retrovirus-related Pol poly from [Prunus dulcis]